MNKKYVLLCLIVLSGCSNSNTTPINSNSNISTSNNTTESINSKDCIFDYDFINLDTNTACLEFFNDGNSTVNSIFTANSLKLKNEGMYRSKQFTNEKDSIDIYMLAHFTGMNYYTSDTIGQVCKFKISGLKYNSETNENIEVDSVIYEHVVTQEDVTNKYFNDFPKYSEDFSSFPYKCTLNGNDISKVEILVLDRATFIDSNNKTGGSNLEIHNIKVYN